MSKCKKCGKDLKKEENKYCSLCEDQLKKKLESLEKELDLEEHKKKEAAWQARKLKEEALKNDEPHKDKSETDKSESDKSDKNKTPDSEKIKIRPDKIKEFPQNRPSPEKGTHKKDKSASSDDNPNQQAGADADAEDSGVNVQGPASAGANREKLLTSRIFAGAVDLLIIITGWWLCGRVYSVIGWVFAAVYTLFKDVLFDQGSPGKMLCGIAVVRTKTLEPLTLQVSIVRNITLAGGFVFMGIGRLLMFNIPFIPDPFMAMGSFLFSFGALAFVCAWCLEFYWMQSDRRSFRFGDKIARTTVIFEKDAPCFNVPPKDDMPDNPDPAGPEIDDFF